MFINEFLNYILDSYIWYVLGCSQGCPDVRDIGGGKVILTNFTPPLGHLDQLCKYNKMEEFH